MITAHIFCSAGDKIIKRGLLNRRVVECIKLVISQMKGVLVQKIDLRKNERSMLCLSSEKLSNIKGLSQRSRSVSLLLPMTRGLKGAASNLSSAHGLPSCFTATPDDKGTESYHLGNIASSAIAVVSLLLPMTRGLKDIVNILLPCETIFSFTATPDDKGTERSQPAPASPCAPVRFTATPDDKGTERYVAGRGRGSLLRVSLLLPMTRGLKGISYTI